MKVSAGEPSVIGKHANNNNFEGMFLQESTF